AEGFGIRGSPQTAGTPVVSQGHSYGHRPFPSALRTDGRMTAPFPKVRLRLHALFPTSSAREHVPSDRKCLPPERAPRRETRFPSLLQWPSSAPVPSKNRCPAYSRDRAHPPWRTRYSEDPPRFLQCKTQRHG